MSVSVKRKPVYCGACSMNITNAMRIRCAQLQPAPSTSATQAASSSNSLDHANPEATTKKHEPLDSFQTGPRSDGMVPTCDEFDICGSCFCEGKEVGRHKRWHDYRVVTQHAYPIFTDDWGADEELLLISACQTFGLGNWADIAEHIGSYRTKEEVEAHYLATFIDTPEYPLPVTDVKLIDRDTFQARKRQRLEEAQERPVPIPPPKPLASAPTCHEIAGFMPGRLEFETEWENDAEALIKDMEFGLVHRYGGDQQPTREEALPGSAAGGRTREDSAAIDARQPQASAPSGRGLGNSTAGAAETGENGNDAADNKMTSVGSANTTAAKGKDSDGNDNSVEETKEDVIQIWDETDDDLELKLTIMEIYNGRIERRLDAKQVIFDRGLLEYKKLVSIDKKRPKEERDLLNRLKPFSRLQTAQDHEEFANGLLYEQMLRKQICDLQEYRQAGITTFAEVDKYEKEKSARIAARGANNYREAILLSRNSLNRPGAGESNAASREGTPKPTNPSHARRLPVPQLNFANSASLQLLSPEERKLCSELRILPKPFLFIKQSLLREFARCGGKLDKEKAVELMAKVDPRTVERIWEDMFANPDEEDAENDDEEEDDGDANGEDEGETAGIRTRDQSQVAEEDSDSDSDADHLSEELQQVFKQEAEAQANPHEGEIALEDLMKD